MMHRNGKKTPFRAAQPGIFAKNSENTSRNTSWLNYYCSWTYAVMGSITCKKTKNNIFLSFFDILMMFFEKSKK